MSFSSSVSDILLLTQLAWKTVKNSRQAGGEYADLTRDVLSLHVVLQRLQKEAAKPESAINRFGNSHREELAGITGGCRKTLNKLDQVLEKYNALSNRDRSARKLWQLFWFGNGKMASLGDLRSRVTYHTSAISLYLNMVSIGSTGRVEKQMDDAGGLLREIRLAVNGITAHLLASSNKEGSVLTTYPDGGGAVWKEFRRELIRDGFSSSVIQKHKKTIKAYVKELGSRGLLDDGDPAEVDRHTNTRAPEDEISMHDGLDEESTGSGSTGHGSSGDGVAKDGTRRDGISKVHTKPGDLMHQPQGHRDFHELPHGTSSYRWRSPSPSQLDCESETDFDNDTTPTDSGRDSHAIDRAGPVGGPRSLTEKNLYEHIRAETVIWHNSQSSGSCPPAYIPEPLRDCPRFSAALRRCNFVTGEIPMSQCFQAFQKRLQRILYCVPRNGFPLSNVGSIATQGQVHLHDDLQLVLEYIHALLNLISNLDASLENWLAHRRPFPSDLGETTSLCEEFLQELSLRLKHCRLAVIAKSKGPASGRLAHNDLDLAAAWIKDNNAQFVDAYYRLRVKFGATPKRVDDYVLRWNDGYRGNGDEGYPSSPDFSVTDACEDLRSKCAAEKLHDLCLIARHGYESRCSDFLLEPPDDSRTRVQVCQVLMDEILQNVVHRLAYVYVGTDQELCTFRYMIAGMAWEMLEESAVDREPEEDRISWSYFKSLTNAGKPSDSRSMAGIQEALQHIQERLTIPTLKLKLTTLHHPRALLTGWRCSFTVVIHSCTCGLRSDGQT